MTPFHMAPEDQRLYADLTRTCEILDQVIKLFEEDERPPVALFEQHMRFVIERMRLNKRD